MVEADSRPHHALPEPHAHRNGDTQLPGGMASHQPPVAPSEFYQKGAEPPPRKQEAPFDAHSPLGEPGYEWKHSWSTLKAQMPAGLENPGLDGSHPPANTPGGMSDGGPRSNYSERAHSPSAILRQEEEEEEEEEQADDETYEQFEERVVNKRAGQMLLTIKRRLRNNNILFSEMMHNNNRKQVAQKFYTMLVLKKLQAVELTQEGPFTEMFISKGTLFENASL